MTEPIEQEKRIAAEVMDNLKINESQERKIRRYVKRAVDKILIYCCREDLPTQLEGTAAQMAEDLLKADGVAESGGSVATITRGDTSISYRDDSASQTGLAEFVKNYETSLNHFKKMRLPKGEGE